MDVNLADARVVRADDKLLGIGSDENPSDRIASGVGQDEAPIGLFLAGSNGNISPAARKPPSTFNV